MRQFFTLIAVCALSTLNAQVFSEDFNDGVPGDLIEDTVNGNLSWTDCGGDTGGIACDGAATFYHGSQSAYNTALDTPVLDLSTGYYKASFTLAKREKDSKVNWFFIEISNDGGVTWTVVDELLDEIINPTTYTYVLTPYNLTAQTVVRFRGTNKGGYALYLDNVSVEEVTGDDASIQNLDVPSIIVAGDVEVKGTLSNLGINPITSFDLNWQVDGGATNTQTYSGQNITSGQSFNFTHEDIWSATGGNHNLNVWVSNLNITDVDPDNNAFSKDIMVASDVAIKIPLMEKFSSSTCYPCFLFNSQNFNPFFNDYGHENGTFISYQVNWPGNGDPYYTTEVGARRSYYGVTAAPTLYFDAVDVGTPSSAQLRILLEELRYGNDNISFFDIQADHTINGNTIDVNVDIHPYISANYTVRVMVFEKETTQNTGGNGETEFHHVFMKALPNPAGTTIEFTQDEVETLSFSHDMSSTFVEEIEDLAVLVFIQDDTTKAIIDSRYTEASNIVLGTNDLTAAQVTLVPNPTSGIVKIMTDRAMDVQVFDLTGKKVFNQSEVADNSSLNLTHLAKGVYVVVMTDDKGAETVKKLVIK